MRVLLVSVNRSQLPMPVMPAGACLIAEAAEGAGHEVRLLDLMFVRDVQATLEAAVNGFRPEAIGLSVRNIDNVDMGSRVSFIDDLQGTVGILRGLTDAPLILGGAALGVMPEAILRVTSATCAVIGEGESTFPRLLDRISRGESLDAVPGTAVLGKGGFRLSPPTPGLMMAPSAAPDYSRWLDLPAYRSRLATAPLQTRRGCPFDCVYCTYPHIEGSVCRLIDPESVAGAVTRLTAAGQRDIEIVDSIFNADPGHALAVCSALARRGRGARLQCLELNPRHLDDELLTAMEGAGFVGMGITLESASDQVLQGLNKGFSSRDVHQAAEAVRRHRIPCAWMFLFGGPGETQETVRETLRFAATRIRPGDTAFFNTGVRIYPGTELETIARRQGVLSSPAGEMLSPTFYVSPEVEARWIEGEVKQAMANRLNFIDIGSLSMPWLPALYRLGAKLGLRPPLWRHTRTIRRALQLAGLDA